LYRAQTAGEPGTGMSCYVRVVCEGALAARPSEKYGCKMRYVWSKLLISSVLCSVVKV